ncbi:amidase signature domain-containing protein [Xylaria grammica]|nr:amidase signature domain-containing protein [Xylaria grammica]
MEELRFSLSNRASSPLPVTVLLLEPGQTIDSVWLERETRRMIEYDDVINDSFFEHLILCYSSHDQPAVEVDIDSASLGNCHVCKGWKPSTRDSCLRSGPYILRGLDLYPVFRLYDDPYAAFMFGVVNDGASSPRYQVYEGLQIPVPSRLYVPPASDEYPLRGKRIAVKDIFDLAGVPTSASCRDYQAFSGNAKRSSSMVTRLIDAGAVIVGKTKTVQFASGEHARDWVDYKCPLSPRGGGYLDPGGSSTGSAVAIAAYDWLDYSIGTDTLGSMLGPAAIQGIFGIRPTHGISDLDGVLPVSWRLDTAGFFARSVIDFRVFGRSWYGSKMAPSQDFTQLLYANSEFEKFPVDVRTAMNSFVDDMVQVMGRPKTLLDIATVWDGEEASIVKKTLNEYLSTTLAQIQLFDCYNNNLKFREEFRKLHGREPYVNPMIRFKWELGSLLTPEQYEQACGEQEFYRMFLRHRIFGDNAVLVLPGGSPKPQYRDGYDAFPDQRAYSLQGFGFLRDVYSFLGGLPQLIIPIGEVHRQSPVTGDMTQEPISISLVGAPGMDCALMDLAERVLRESKRPMTVFTGSSLFGQERGKLGDIHCNVATP